MKVLWLCNIMLPLIAEHFQMEASNKEGWLTGLVDALLSDRRENQITLAIAYPAPAELLQREGQKDILRAELTQNHKTLVTYGFGEDTVHPECYEDAMERTMQQITQDFAPDLVHCFGTEYPHTLALCRVFPQRDRIVVGIQGLCAVYAKAYFANLPEKVIHTVTLRDWLKRDSLVKQQDKFAKRGEQEKAAIMLAGNVIGRTAWDFHYAQKWHPQVRYYSMNETLRTAFYEGEWKLQAAQPHSIFVSQGDYPIKGLHYLLLALPAIREKYPDVKVYVAGNSIVKYDTGKDKLKISAYGKYLRSLLAKEKLWEQVVFLGRLKEQEMKAQYLKSHLFVCCSAIENSPNSLGEAMLLGMPCVSAQVGGIETIFDKNRDGIAYDGFYTKENSFDVQQYPDKIQGSNLENNVKGLEQAILQMWENDEVAVGYGRAAREHALRTHDREQNYERLLEIYRKILCGDKNSTE